MIKTDESEVKINNKIIGVRTSNMVGSICRIVYQNKESVPRVKRMMTGCVDETDC
jgi:hypothetical protein